MSRSRFFFTFLAQGGLLGIANIIPGVSGGTMALMLGIYERLIASLNSIDARLARTLFGAIRLNPQAVSRLQQELKRIDFYFLVCLGFGAVLAILATSRLIVYLLTEHHDPTYGFFLGLILASIVVPCKMFRKFQGKHAVVILLAAVLTLSVTTSMSGPENLANAQKKHQLKIAAVETITSDKQEVSSVDYKRLLWFFVCGAVAISAMILPGISGSFLLILLGVYFDILDALSRFDLPVIAIFAAGIGIGIILFARFLNFAFKNYHDLTISFLIGLMIGSLYQLWPFKSFAMVGSKRVDLEHILPATNFNLLMTICTFICGCLVVLFMLWNDHRQSKNRN